MKRKALLRTSALILTMTGGSVASPVSAIVFTDGTFDLSVYTVETHQTGGATITVAQTLTGGNPGAGLQILRNNPAVDGDFQAVEYFLNSATAHDPKTDGTVLAIDVALDTFTQTSAPFNFTINGVAHLIRQNGSYYVHGIPLPLIQGAYFTGTQSGLLATDFDLVTDLALISTDSTKHPNFAEGLLEFGFATGWKISGQVASMVVDHRVDNLLIGVVAVPEPADYVLMLSGLVILGLARWRRSRR